MCGLYTGTANHRLTAKDVNGKPFKNLSGGFIQRLV
jgi:hypothetical protein